MQTSDWRASAGVGRESSRFRVKRSGGPRPGGKCKTLRGLLFGSRVPTHLWVGHFRSGLLPTMVRGRLDKTTEGRCRGAPEGPGLIVIAHKSRLRGALCASITTKDRGVHRPAPALFAFGTQKVGDFLDKSKSRKCGFPVVGGLLCLQFHFSRHSRASPPARGKK